MPVTEPLIVSVPLPLKAPPSVAPMIAIVDNVARERSNAAKQMIGVDRQKARLSAADGSGLRDARTVDRHRAMRQEEAARRLRLLNLAAVGDGKRPLRADGERARQRCSSILTRRR